MTTAETISGVVEARNERGIRVCGEWHNVSKFKPLELPDVGAQVALGLDPKGYITTLEVLDVERKATDCGFRSGGKLATSVGNFPQQCPRADSHRDQTITRLSVLKSAAAFAANREDIKSADVLRIAASWLAWIEQ